MSGNVTVSHFTLQRFNADVTELNLATLLKPIALKWGGIRVHVELDQISLKTPQRFLWRPVAGSHSVTLIGSIGRENQPMVGLRKVLLF